MMEKKLYIYMRDEEYGKRLLKYLTSKHGKGLKAELMTQREVFWESRAYSEFNSRERWLTDDAERADADRGDKNSLIILSDRADINNRKISYLQKSRAIYSELITILELNDSGTEDGLDAPEKGVYGVYSTDEKAAYFAPLLAQGLGEYGKCMYVALAEFPYFYDEKREEIIENKRYLGELIFRLELNEYKIAVDELSIDYGSAKRLPGCAHFRDISDISDDDIKRFIKRLGSECELDYIVICIDRAQTLMAAYTECNRLCILRDNSDFDRVKLSLLNRYLSVENKDEIMELGDVITLPDEWQDISYEMENKQMQLWLFDDNKKQIAERMWMGDS